MLRLGEPLQAMVQTDWLLCRVCGKNRQVQRDVPERVNCCGHILARLADHIALKLTRKHGIHNAVAISRVHVRPSNEVLVEQIESGDEELVRILLLIACQMVCVCPGHVQQDMWDQGRFDARIELLEQTRELADNALLPLAFVVTTVGVSVGKEIVPEWNRVDQTLHNHTHETGIAKVNQA